MTLNADYYLKDATLQRCFGVDKKIVDCDWKFLSDLRTLKEPREPMPRLEDLIRYLTRPEVYNTWLMLDIKVDNNVQLDAVFHKLMHSID